MNRILLVLAVFVTAAFAVAACGDDDDDADAEETSTESEGTAVDVTLEEFAVLPALDSAPAGDVTFNVSNEGPDDFHEFVVFRTDLAPDALPTADDGTVDEAGEGVELIGEIEDIAVGESPSVSFDLAAGSYVFICNISEEAEGELEVHYQLGMRTGFTVE